MPVSANSCTVCERSQALPTAPNSKFSTTRCGLPLQGSQAATDDQQWGQASRGLWCGGLGLRATACHADAAYVASRTATRASCQQVNPDFGWEASRPETRLGQALAALNSQLHPADRVSADPAKPLRQQDLSQALKRLDHEALYEALEAADRADPVVRDVTWSI